MTIFYANWPTRVHVVESWSRLKTYNAGVGVEQPILVADVSFEPPVGAQEDEAEEVR